MMEKGKIIPFYMAYPLPLYYEDEQEVVKDMEYLQSQHSSEIRSLQREIMEVINLLDYEGSMIYDEYPDRFSMERQSRMICERLKSKYQDDDTCKFRDMLSWEGFQDIIRLLMYDEILKRRHRKSRGYLRF